MNALRVVALATNIPGPLAAEALARDGASVIKVEPPAGDPLENAAPAWYARIVEPMEVVRLDLRAAGGLSAFLRLLDGADVLITTVRPKALARRGLDADALARRYPQLCRVAVVGEAGKRADHAGHDLTYQANAGLLAPPAHPRTVFADMFAAERTLAAVYRLAFRRAQTGAGGFEEIAIAQGAAVLMDAHRYGLTSREGPLGGGSPLYRTYRTADGWIALAALEPHFQEKLTLALGPQLDAQTLEAAFAQQANAHWERLARDHDLPLAAIA